MATPDPELVALVKAHEGYRRYAYECSQGRLTVGYGTMIEAGGHGIPEYIAELLLLDYLATLGSRFEALDWFKALDTSRRRAVLEMGYQLGYEGVLGFRRMIDAIQASDWPAVYAEALDSRWARQTPARARDVAHRIAYGAGRAPDGP